MVCAGCTRRRHKGAYTFHLGLLKLVVNRTLSDKDSYSQR